VSVLLGKVSDSEKRFEREYRIERYTSRPEHILGIRAKEIQGVWTRGLNFLEDGHEDGR